MIGKNLCARNREQFPADVMFSAARESTPTLYAKMAFHVEKG
jgi:hypothetical protein